MVAYDPRRPPDPARTLRPETVAALRGALEAQRRRGPAPTEELFEAVHAASIEARDNQLSPEALTIQLKELADEASLPPITTERDPREVRRWMVSICLRAYFDPPRDGQGGA